MDFSQFLDTIINQTTDQPWKDVLYFQLTLKTIRCTEARWFSCFCVSMGLLPPCGYKTKFATQERARFARWTQHSVHSRV